MFPLQPIHFTCAPSGLYSNSHLPVIYYRSAVDLPVFFKKSAVKKVLGRNGWSHLRTTEIPDHFCYSDCHIVIVSIRGSMTLQFGGEFGQRVRLQRSGAIVIPAGMVYRTYSQRETSTYLTAQPKGPARNIHVEISHRRPNRSAIASLPTPPADPIYGAPGPLFRLWAPASDFV